MRVSRRTLLLSASAALAGCATRRTPLLPPAARLSRVRVSPDRVIRTIVGLRPYRPSGFVVRAEKFGDKLVVHNYGHGGAGITLSWGTAQLAVDEGMKGSRRDCAVIGCGVVGLSTARLLQERGFQPTIYAREMPPATTSNVAGGLWSPVTVYDHTRITSEFRTQYAAAAATAFRRYQSLAGEWYGVRWLPLYSLDTEGPHQMPPPTSANYTVEPLYPAARQLTASENPFPAPFAYRKQSMLIEPAIYLAALVRDFELAGGKIVIREFRSSAEIASLTESTVYNCTGLGARTLFGDEELTPVRGQLTFLLPQPEIDYMTVGPGDIYMFPRRDGILLGGTHEEGNWSLAVNEQTTARVLRENAALFNGMR